MALCYYYSRAFFLCVFSFTLPPLFRVEDVNLTNFFIIALVLLPTRELCMQVHEILQKMLHRFHWIVPGCIMGGENRKKEKARLQKGRYFMQANFI